MNIQNRRGNYTDFKIMIVALEKAFKKVTKIKIQEKVMFQNRKTKFYDIRNNQDKKNLFETFFNF